MKKLVVFSGNRAEFGILYPLIKELSDEYEVELILSGAHVLKKWNTQREVKEVLQQNKIKCKLHLLHIPEVEDVYTSCFATIYEKTLKFYSNEKKTVAAIVLGDRVESFAFAVASFYAQIPLFHFFGGDVVTVRNFDTNVRHSISKIANYHFVTNEVSESVLLQMGEEEERVFKVGNLSYDYERLGMLTSVNVLNKKFGIESEEVVVIYTYHPACTKTAQNNFNEFKAGLDAIIDSNADKIIITYPNNDPGYDLIIEYIDSIKQEDRVRCVNTLGTYNYLSIMKNYKTIVAGNSSGGLLETAIYCVPTVNIGDRQNGRIRGRNVVDVEPNYEKIKELINNICANYEEISKHYEESRYLFGRGDAAVKAKEYIGEILKKTKEEMLFKKFIIR